ncbi:CCR4-NOT transcription complex subunit 6-like [Sarcoptes scabiei]|nr:CCR4-NOT transcription complex subunit 6-like [Sarcoptes scabiei]UXI14100.1 CCR4-NOT transcription complex subunit 6-like protein [Sarcoptes scabiei]
MMPIMSRPGHRDRDNKYEPMNPRRAPIILTSDDVAQGKESYWSELEITGLVRNLSPQLWSFTHLTGLYLNDNSLTKLSPDIGKLQHLQVLDLSNNKLRNLPGEIGDLIMLRELYLMHNNLRQLPYELGRLFQLQSLALKGNPLTQELLVIYNEQNGVQKLLTYLLDNLQVPDLQPPTRPWLPKLEPTRNHHVSNVFTVMSYNVLCDKLASRQLYAYCPSWALSWDFRKNIIMKEIKQYDADIICLQEVESGQFEAFFLPELKTAHYYGIFSPKSRAKTMNEQERKRVDGCAIFFKTEKFELVHEHLMEFTFLAAQTADGEGSEEMLNRVMPKDNIGLVALLKTKEVELDISPNKSKEFQNMEPFESQPLVICTAHIHWDPEYCDVKLIQTMLMMRELQKFIDQSASLFNLKNDSSDVDPNSIPLILCGDFNSLPESGVVEYLSKGKISVEHADFKKLAYKLCLRKICPVVDQNDKDYTHPFDIIKAYNDDVLPFTNYTFDFRGVIDYIFCSKRFFSVLGVLGPLDSNWFTKHRIPGCPHHYIPSDHFPIVAELELLTKRSMEKEKFIQDKKSSMD